MVAVCEERVIGIPIMLLDNPTLQIVILDDAFQHRPVKAGLSILLTDYSDLYTRDQLLPSGNLREPLSSAARADVIVVTKCSKNISADERKKITAELRSKEGQPVFFSTLQYDQPYHAFDASKKFDPGLLSSVLLVTAIASGKRLLNELEKNGGAVKHSEFADHHRFSFKEVKEIIIKAKEISSDQPIIITTEKDMTRLLLYRDQFVSEQVEIYCIPVQVKFIGDDEAKFNSMALRFIEAKMKDDSDG
jgi:tetraacyldisaccharide 4'-kinase